MLLESISSTYIQEEGILIPCMLNNTKSQMQDKEDNVSKWCFSKQWRLEID